MLSDVEQCEIQELDLGTTAPISDRFKNRFVVDEQNQLLAALFESLLPDRQSSLPHCNPLTLVGPSGSGKSMLAQGIVRRWQSDSSQQSAPAEKVAYFTAADFGRELQALQEDSANPSELRTWRRSVRQVELLVIEDLDQLRQRSTIQQELCRCIDAIVDRGGRVIVTASREPLTLTNLRGDGDALVDRLSAGLVLRLQSPGPAARRHLLRSIAANRDLNLDEQQLTTLVNRSGSQPAAKLFGLLTEFDYDLQATRHAETVASNVEQLSLKEITTVVCRYLGLKKTDLASSSRRKSLTQARGITVVLARQLTSLSYAEIGRHLGGRDHSTMISAAKKVTRDRSKIPALEHALGELEHLLTAK